MRSTEAPTLRLCDPSLGLWSDVHPWAVAVERRRVSSRVGRVPPVPLHHDVVELVASHGDDEEAGGGDDTQDVAHDGTDQGADRDQRDDGTTQALVTEFRHGLLSFGVSCHRTIIQCLSFSKDCQPDFAQIIKTRLCIVFL